MKKKVAAMTLAVYLSGGFGTAYASMSNVSNTNQIITEVTSPTVISEDENLIDDVEVLVIEDSAGILPNSSFYSIERGIEQLQIAITQSEEKLAALMAQLATERVAEAAIMVNEGEEELANKATLEYMELLASVGEHMNNAIKAKNEAVQTLETFNEEYKKSETILKAMLETAPENARVDIESALNEQDKVIAVVNGFYAAKEAFFAAKVLLKEAKKELEAAKGSDDEEAIRIAQEKVKVAEALKDQLEALKDSADLSKEEIKYLVEQAEKKIELGLKQTKKGNEKMAKVEEKNSENARKSGEKAKKKEDKEKEKAKKKEDKEKEKAIKEEEKADRGSNNIK